MTRALFVTGTDTDIGKTYCTALLARTLRASGLAVGCCKPVCSGAEVDPGGELRWGDIEALHAALDGSFARELICPHRFGPPLAPPVAAREAGEPLTLSMLTEAVHAWRDRVDFLLVEGVGGLLCPLTDSATIADFITALDIPTLVVTADRLGTLNHTLLTLEVANSRGLDVRGVIMNHITTRDDDASIGRNQQELLRWSVPLIASVKPGGHNFTSVRESAALPAWTELFAPMS